MILLSGVVLLKGARSPPTPAAFVNPPQIRCCEPPGETRVITSGLEGDAAACPRTLALSAQMKLDPDPREAHPWAFAPGSSTIPSPQCRVQQCLRRAIRFQEASPAANHSPFVQGFALPIPHAAKLL